MRLVEGLRLGVKDVDFERGVIIVRDAKGGKARAETRGRWHAEAAG
jgi:integrase